MLNTLLNTWRSLRGRRPLDVLDVIAEADAEVGVDPHASLGRSA